MASWLLAAVLLASGAAAADPTKPPLASGPWGNRDPVADPAAVVVSGAARFTVLTDRVIRMEYDPTETFEDRATMAIINRKLPTVSFQQENDGAALTISTSALKLTYLVGQEFLGGLSIESVDESSTFTRWAFGQADPGNLLGTIRTLDGENMPTLNCTLVRSRMNNQCGWDESGCQCEWGVVGREGWALVDDADNYALSADSDFWDGPNADAVDAYFFGHGSDYKGALKDFVAVGGSVAMPPRQAVGVWFTRWYDYTQGTAEQVVRDFEKRSLPLDILVLDMNWHLKNDWTGYTFDERLFPHREDLFRDLHARGLLSAGNLHDADGVAPFEDRFEALCAALGLDPATTDKVPYNISDEAAQTALEDTVLLPLEGEGGFDFWWIDWQQGEAGYGAPGGKKNPTIWTAHQRATDKQRRGSSERAMVLARWGGLGGHRYQVGFSGDVKDVTWSTLRYQPYFSATAANVGFGFWSHDLTGPAADEELYVRWLQWGAHSGVLRMHDRGESAGPCSDQFDNNTGSDGTCFLVRPWEATPSNFEAVRGAVEARGRLLPYLYTALRQAHDSGLGLLRPMYYEHPAERMAYLQSLAMPQYYLGDDLLVSPVVARLDPSRGLASQPLWVPPGTFVERDTGLVRTGHDATAITASSPASSPASSQGSDSCGVASFASIDCATSEGFSEEQCLARGCCWSGDGGDKGGDSNPKCYFSRQMEESVVTKQADIAEVPVLVRAGAILIEAGEKGGLIGRAGRQYESLSLTVFLSGAERGQASLYEDDGKTIAYATHQQAAFAFTDAKWRVDDAHEGAQLLTVTVGAAGGAGGEGFPELPTSRDYEIRLANSPPPAAVAVQGVAAKASRYAAPSSSSSFEPSWYYDGAAAELVVRAQGRSTAAAFDVTVTLALPTNDNDAKAAASEAEAKKSGAGSGGKARADRLLSGVRGALRRAVQAKEVLNEARICPGEATGQTAANGFGATQRLASTGSVLSHAAMLGGGDGAAAFWAAVAGLPAAVEGARAELKAVNATALGDSAWRLGQAKAMLEAAAEDLAL